MLKRILFIGLLFGFYNLAIGASTLKDDQEKLSYVIGYDLGQNFRNNQIMLNSQIFMQGLNDAIASKASVVSEQEASRLTSQLQQKLAKQTRASSDSEADKNLKAGEAFLAKNAKKAGVKTTSSGLQYHIIKAENGPKPTASDTVKVDYEGKFIDGKVFDSSYSRGKPAIFRVNQVIPGWTEALQLMPVGSTWELYIPAQLGYGKEGASGSIPPNSALIFKVHLISIEK